MTDIVALGLVAANIALVIVTVVYVAITATRARQSKKAMLEQKHYQVEGDITQLQIKRAEFLDKAQKKTKDGKSAMDIINERKKQCKETVDRVVEELKKLKKKPNWVSDETLHWSEKAFHGTVVGFGVLLLSIVLKLLWDVAHRDIQGIEPVVLIVVLMLLAVFGFFCISGRGVEVLERLRDKIVKAELVKLWGFTIKTSPSEKEKK